MVIAPISQSQDFPVAVTLSDAGTKAEGDPMQPDSFDPGACGVKLIEAAPDVVIQDALARVYHHT